MKRDTFKTLINYIIISMLFSEAWVWKFSAAYPFMKVYNIIFALSVIVLIFLLKGVYINKNFILVFIVVVFFSFLNILYDNVTLGLVLKQIAVILTHAVVFYLLIKYNQGNIKALFRIYLNIAFIVAAIGLLQAGTYLGRKYSITAWGLFPYNRLIVPFYDYRWLFTNWLLTFGIPGPFGIFGLRINSIMPEPSSLCLILMPAVFVSMASFLKRNYKFISLKKGMVIIAAFLLSFSTLGALGVVIALGVLLLRDVKERWVIIRSSLVIIIIAVVFYNTNRDLRFRVSDTYNLLTAKKGLSSANRSAYTLVRNAMVTGYALKKECMFGMGLGSHIVSFERQPNQIFVLNRRDANSLLSRMLSETGLIGTILFLIFFIVRGYVGKKQDTTGYLWLINNAVLVLFILRLIRQGNYVSEGFFFFFWLYYFSKKKVIKNKSQEDLIKEKAVAIENTY